MGKLGTQPISLRIGPQFQLFCSFVVMKSVPSQRLRGGWTGIWVELLKQLLSGWTPPQGHYSLSDALFSAIQHFACVSGWFRIYFSTPLYQTRKAAHRGLASKWSGGGCLK